MDQLISWDWLFCLTDHLFGCIAVVESCMMIVAYLVPNFLMGLIAGAGVLGIIMVTVGFFRLLPDLSNVIWLYPVSYLGYGSWSRQGGFKNDMLEVMFEPLIPGDPKLKGEHVLKNMFRLNISYSKWWDLLALYTLFIFYRILFFFILKLKERATPFFRSLYTKRTIHYPNSMPSFKKRPSQTNYCKNLHPLSSQEGLSSPVP